MLGLFCNRIVVVRASRASPLLSRQHTADMVRVFQVVQPSCGVFGNVLTNAVQTIFVADDVLVIIALPDHAARSFSGNVDLFC